MKTNTILVVVLVGVLAVGAYLFFFSGTANAAPPHDSIDDKRKPRTEPLAGGLVIKDGGAASTGSAGTGSGSGASKRPGPRPGGGEVSKIQAAPTPAGTTTVTPPQSTGGWTSNYKAPSAGAPKTNAPAKNPITYLKNTATIPIQAPVALFRGAIPGGSKTSASSAFKNRTASR